MINLRECPLCCGEADIDVEYLGDSYVASVNCNDCTCSVTAYADTAKNAINNAVRLWNTRTNERIGSYL